MLSLAGIPVVVIELHAAAPPAGDASLATSTRNAAVPGDAATAGLAKELDPLRGGNASRVFRNAHIVLLFM
jgi:hypothetical protein